MKNTIKLFGVIALAVLVMFAVVACNEPEDDPKLPSELQNTRWDHVDGHRMTFGTNTVFVVPKSRSGTTYTLKENQSVKTEGISQNNLVFGDNAYITYRDGNIQLVWLGDIQESGGWSEYLSGITDSVVSQLSGKSGGGSTKNPVTLSLNFELSKGSLEDMLYGLGRAKKYVNLDLSACSGDTFSPPWSGSDAEKYIVSLILPETVMSIYWRYLYNLTSVSGASSATSVGFQGCSKLTSVSFPAATSIGERAFDGCSSLTSVNFPLVTSIGESAFEYCTKLTSVSFPAAISIGKRAFYECTSLTSASFPAAISIGQYTFAGCSKLTSASFPAATSIAEGAFSGCTSLTSVSFPASVNLTGNPFVWSTKLTSFTLTGTGSLSTIESGKALVRNNTELVAYPSASGNITLNNITSIGDSAFYVCNSLTTVSFPAVINIGNSAFERCNSLTTVSFPAVTTIGNVAFSDCTSLTSVSFPVATSIGNGPFVSCHKLTTVSFPAATSIGYSVFSGCTSLTTVSLPAVTSTGFGIFDSTGTIPLTITLGATAPSLNAPQFTRIDSAKTVTVKVPSGATGYGTIPATYSGSDTTANWGNGFRGAGWNGTGFIQGGVAYINSNIRLTVQYQ
ncbi:MAG: leucine-rich repeat domain-containing protein [Treponema sp.]|jgi:hypothetical protein|nr:leucine-rich repeat domain-containing protein [Treponema sp.]